jgi:hypothetical protein
MSDTRKEIMERLGSAGKVKAGRAEQVLRDGTVHLDFVEAAKWIPTLTEQELRGIVADARAAANAQPQGKKWNYYHDLVLTASDELQKRKRKSSRHGAKAKFADVGSNDNKIRYLLGEAESAVAHLPAAEARKMVADYIRKAESLVEAKTPAELTSRIRRVKSMAARPGAKAKFAEDAREVAQEILRQLGGGRFMAMVGGKNAFHGTFGGKAGLQFDIGKGADGGVNRVIVKLDRGTDTYDMEFWRIGNRGMNVKKVSEASGVYADDLQRIFTSRTKFYTSLARAGAKAKFGNADRLDSLIAAVYRALKNNDKEAAKRLMTDAAKEIDSNTPAYIVAEYKDLKRSMSRPGAKAKFEQAAWMPNIQQFLRNLTAEKQKIRVWIAGPTTVKVAGAWQDFRGPFGLGAAIANRTAYWLQQAAKQAGSTASMEGEDRKNEPRKGVNTTIWTVKDIPADAVAYLKAWGIGTTPGTFAGFTGQSAVAYARPGAKSKMAYAPSESDMKKWMKGWTLRLPMVPDAGIRHFNSFEEAKRYGDAKCGGFSCEISYDGRRVASKGALSPEGSWTKHSRPGAKAHNAADILKVEVMDGSTVTSSMTPSDFMAYAKRSLPGIASTSSLPDMIARFNELAEEKGMRVRVRSNLAKSKNAIREGEKVSASDDAVSRKIRKLMDEGKPQKQAVAIALDLERRGEL